MRFRALRESLQEVLTVLEPRAFPKYVPGKAPQRDEATYRTLFLDAVSRRFPETEEFETSTGFAVDQDWINDLALHTQVVQKKSKLNWQHGHILYSLLRKHIESIRRVRDSVQVFETGTARGFSAVCMGKAIVDSNHPGVVVTIDSIPHNRAMYWNCIDDVEGQKSRRELLEPWSAEVARVVFFQAVTPQQLGRVGMDRIDFAFLDAQHTFESVMAEYKFVEERQSPGDLIVFDDVTPGVFDGVVAAVNTIRDKGLYEVQEIGRRTERGYAVAQRLDQ